MTNEQRLAAGLVLVVAWEMRKHRKLRREIKELDAAMYTMRSRMHRMGLLIGDDGGRNGSFGSRHDWEPLVYERG